MTSIGCLKNGSLPTYRNYIKTQKNYLPNSNMPIQINNPVNIPMNPISNVPSMAFNAPAISNNINAAVQHNTRPATNRSPGSSTHTTLTCTQPTCHPTRQ
jgi:hypothetical protein